MNEWQTLLVPALGHALLHFLWQGALIGLTTAIVLQLLRDARPQLRYAVACLALLACALVPMLGVLLELLELRAASPLAAPGIAVATTSVTMATQQVFIARAWPADFDRALPWIVAAWAAGAGSLSLRMTLGVIWIQRLRNTPQDGMHAAWQARLDALASRFGLDGVALRVVDVLDSPASAGWWRPVVLLPAALLTRMPVDLIEALLAHELAHIRRHDYLVNLMQGAVEALLFYHPVTWWLSRRIRIERELIADQLAAQATGEPRRLALALSELSELRHTRCPSLHLAQAAHGGHLMSRIEHLVRPGRRSTAGRLAFPVLGVAAACIAFYAHAQIGDAQRVEAAKADVVVPVSQAAPATRVMPASQAAPVSQAAPASQPAAVTPVAQAAPASAPTTRLHVGSKPREAYALVPKDGDSITMSGSTDDLPAIKRAQRNIDADFIWFRHGNQSYVVSDPGIVARANDAWRDSNKLGAQMEALGNEMEGHGAKMEKLGAQMEKLSEGSGRNAAMDAAAKQMELLAAQAETLAAKQSRLAASMHSGTDAQREQVERQMETLSQQQDALSRQMDQQSEVMDAESARMEARMQPMEALGRQMEEAGKPMEALGKRMDALGKEQEKLIDQAEREMDKLLTEAMNKGLAKPAPVNQQ